MRIRVSRVGGPPDPRFSFANERTFLAWNRTALALIGGGLLAAELVTGPPRGAGLLAGLPLIGLGAVIACFGFARWRAQERALRLGARLSRARFPAAFLAAATGCVTVLSMVLTIWHGAS